MTLQRRIKQLIKERCSKQQFDNHLKDLINISSGNEKEIYQWTLSYYRLIYSIDDLDCESDVHHFSWPKKKLNKFLIKRLSDKNSSCPNCCLVELLLKITREANEYVKNYRKLAG